MNAKLVIRIGRRRVEAVITLGPEEASRHGLPVRPAVRF
jgi:hypothetical protein